MCLRSFITGAPVQVFSTDKKVAQKDAVCLHPDVAVFDYLRNEVADRLVDRLLDTQNRKYTVALDLGCHSGHIQASLCAAGGGDGFSDGGSTIGDVEELWNVDSSSGMLRRCAEQFPVGSPLRCHSVPGNEEELHLAEGVTKGKFDLIMSCLSLHWLNDLPGTLTQVRQVREENSLRGKGFAL
jgi:ubiquinone/menaquinone biosynthesis C-methylase UbiE